MQQWILKQLASRWASVLDNNKLQRRQHQKTMTMTSDDGGGRVFVRNGILLHVYRRYTRSDRDDTTSGAISDNNPYTVRIRNSVTIPRTPYAGLSSTHVVVPAKFFQHPENRVVSDRPTLTALRFISNHVLVGLLPLARVPPRPSRFNTTSDYGNFGLDIMSWRKTFLRVCVCVCAPEETVYLHLNCL